MKSWMPFCFLLLFYLAYSLQATVRPEISWHACSPNFLVIFLILCLWNVSEAWGLVFAAVAGLLSDCLAPNLLGADMLCFLVCSVLLQIVCPPHLIRHPGLLLVLVNVTAFLIELSTLALRAGLSQPITTFSDAPFVASNWLGTAIGNSLLTMLMAVPIVLLIHVASGHRVHDGTSPVGNHWHRLTS